MIPQDPTAPSADLVAEAPTEPARLTRADSRVGLLVALVVALLAALLALGVGLSITRTLARQAAAATPDAGAPGEAITVAAVSPGQPEAVPAPVPPADATATTTAAHH